jgi:site-specific recombinase XerD
MSLLRQEFIRDLRLQNFSESTIKTYVSCISSLARHYNKCPSTITKEELKFYLSLLVNQKKGWSTINSHLSAFNKIYLITLHQAEKVIDFKRPRNEKRVPSILSKSEVELVLNACHNLKHKVILMTLYSCGLRVSEVCKIEIKDIDFARKKCIIRLSKGNVSREVVLSPILEEYIKTYRRQYYSETYLFPGFNPQKPYSVRSVQTIIQKVVKKVGISKKVSSHTMRHSFATHCIENHVDIFFLKRLLGHRSLQTTMMYYHLCEHSYDRFKSPLDDLKVM